MNAAQYLEPLQSRQKQAMAPSEKSQDSAIVSFASPQRKFSHTILSALQSSLAAD